MTNVNCKSFKRVISGGICTHQAAPRRLFGSAKCIVYEWIITEHSDPRETEPRCALCTPNPKPPIPKPIENAANGRKL